MTQHEVTGRPEDMQAIKENANKILQTLLLTAITAIAGMSYSALKDLGADLKDHISQPGHRESIMIQRSNYDRLVLLEKVFERTNDAIGRLTVAVTKLEGAIR